MVNATVWSNIQLWIDKRLGVIWQKRNATPHGASFEVMHEYGSIKYCNNLERCRNVLQ